MKIAAPLYGGIYVLSPAINQHINFTSWEKQSYGVVLLMRGEVVGIYYDEQATAFYKAWREMQCR